MRNQMAELEIIDGDGRRRRGRPGERAVFPLQGTHAVTRELMDAMRAPAVVVDAHGLPAGFRSPLCSPGPLKPKAHFRDYPTDFGRPKRPAPDRSGD
jgi:hypothetical protein